MSNGGVARRRTASVLRGVLAVLGLALGLSLSPAVAAQAYDEDVIGQLVNQARWNDGKAGLQRNSAMDQVALAWAQHLASTGSLEHNPDYAAQVPGGWNAVAENVAQGYGSASAVHEGWMNSDGHRANILGNYTDIGIAFIDGGGTTWGVQVFARYAGHEGPSAPAPAPIVEPQPAPAPPAAEPAPAPVPTEAAAAPTTPPEETTSPSASPSSSAEPSPRGTADAELASGRADSALPPTIMLAAAVLTGLALLAALVAIVLWMRRRRHEPDPGDWLEPGRRRSLKR